MIEIDGKIVSTDLLRECFACDLGRCRGICCVEGNAGAPLEEAEAAELRREYPSFKPYMTAEGIAAVEAQGFAVHDEDGGLPTPLGNCANPFPATSIPSGWPGSQTEPSGSTTTDGRYASRPAYAGSGSESRFTRHCAKRSSDGSARSFTGHWKPPRNY